MRVLLDTNIYGKMVLDSDIDQIKNSIQKHENIKIYGTDITRNELRSVPQQYYVNGRKNLRIALLSLFDTINKKVYPATDKISTIANAYYGVYNEFGGIIKYKEVFNDLLIIAIASYHNLDIVVSEDNKTMLSEKMLKAYRSVNNIFKIRTPNFMNYIEFKKILNSRG